MQNHHIWQHCSHKPFKSLRPNIAHLFSTAVVLYPPPKPSHSIVNFPTLKLSVTNLTHYMVIRPIFVFNFHNFFCPSCDRVTIWTSFLGSSEVPTGYRYTFPTQFSTISPHLLITDVIIRLLFPPLDDRASFNNTLQFFFSRAKGVKPKKKMDIKIKTQII